MVRMPQRSARLVDVARAAGVSVPTASQVMNDTGRVADATRERVLAAARDLDYRPNALARSVAMGRSRTIGVLAENAAGAFCMPVLIGINRALSAHDLASVLYDAQHEPDLRRDHIRHMIDRQVDGIIVIGEGPDVAIDDLGVSFSGPVVHAFGPHHATNASSIHPDERAGGALAAQSLIALGRRRIAHVTAEEHLPSVRERSRGFAAALGEAGLEPAAVLHGSFSRGWGHLAAEILHARTPAVDAVFAGSDAIAIGLAAGFEAAGLRVPEDVAIVGYDHVAGYGDDIDPYLASIDPRLTDVGERAARHLIGSLDDEDADASPVVPRFVEGATTRGGDDRRHRLVETLLRTVTAPPVIGTSRTDSPHG
ncbi:LacI family transcriptional regulator [Microbacterium laevaniformans]|uniref:LacI family transcriptional regulator n=2 Tax=Microbacteriaceae TaxID=85023 RepID=A0A4S2D3J0_9MICO|nr:LacI family transcriptional regulator [Microbacterium sp. PM5]TGY36108.1 LacI family transcriptional regulator [Microbacterium laevaniformans]